VGIVVTEGILVSPLSAAAVDVEQLVDELIRRDELRRLQAVRTA
jgi:hypothetical protein